MLQNPCILAVFCPALIFLVHMLWVRFISTESRQMGAAFSIIIAAAILVWLSRSDWPSFIYMTILSLSVGYSYFHVFNMSETARRIRIIREIHENNSLSRDDIAAMYATDEMVERRLVRLVETGQIRIEGNRYFKARSILFPAARVLEFWKRLLNM